MSIACFIQSELDTGEKYLLCSKKPNQQIHFRLRGMGAFSCGVPIFVWVLIIVIGCCNQNGMSIFTGCLFCAGVYYPDFTVC